mmetsp:Transcript_30333/g.56683  ORF Transcript_30333/g.56683 Transcript_30333/m.56683 type:complete len:628 (-) Transcript_30333:256-2139(-)
MSSSSPIKYITGVFRRAKQKIIDTRAEHRAKKMFANSGLVRVSDRLLTMEGEDFELAERVLESFYAGHYLVVIVGSRVSRRCPKGVLKSVKLDFENPDSLSDVVAATQSINRWLLADTNNVVALCAERAQLEKLISCTLYYTLHHSIVAKKDGESKEGPPEPEEAKQKNGKAQRARTKKKAMPKLKRVTTASPPKRSHFKLTPSQTRFIRDFKIAVDNGFTAPGEPLVVKELVIERLPPEDESGAKISIMITQNKAFAFSTMQRGGVIWLPASESEPATACIPIGAVVKDDAVVKVYHHPEHANTSKPQKLLFQVQLHLDVARRKGYLLRFEKGDIDETAVRSSYSDKFRVQLLLEEPETKKVSPFAQPNSKRALNAKKYWNEMKKRKGYVQVTRTDPLALLEESEDEAVEEVKTKEEEGKPESDTKDQTTGGTGLDAKGLAVPAIVRSQSSPPETAISDDMKLAHMLQQQFDMEAKAAQALEGGFAEDGQQAFTGDEDYARQLQMQMDNEVRESRVEMLLRTGAIEPSQLQYDQLLELDENIQRGYSKNAQLLSMLPEFKCKGGQHLERKCMVCFEKFKVGEPMRSLPCIHAFHKKCIDKWLGRSKKCPVCNRRIDEVMQAAASDG